MSIVHGREIALSSKHPQAWYQWHRAIDAQFSGDQDTAERELRELIVPDVVFKPPTYAKIRHGQDFLVMALKGISMLFENFTYTREFIGDTDLVLEFTCTVTDPKTGKSIPVQGADFITLDRTGTKLVELAVVARPPAALKIMLDHQTKFLESFLQKDSKL